jgi:hypothetical protein
MAKKINKKISTSLLIVLGFFMLIMGALYVQQDGKIMPKRASSQIQEPAVDTTGWKMYTDKKSGLQISYPANWIVDINPLSGLPNMVFCPPELAEYGTCKTDSANGTKSLAPVNLSFKSGSNPNYNVGFNGNEKYAAIYDAMKKSVMLKK